MRKDPHQQKIDDLNDEIDEALAAGRPGEAEELYMELEELCRDEN
jgi:hypothetical protein